MKIRNNLCISVLKLHLFAFVPIRTSLELQILLSFCYFSIFKIPSRGFGLSVGAVYKELLRC